MRKDEEIAKHCFKYYLLNRFGLKTHWRRGEDPPDYYMKLQGEEFSVEITSLFGDDQAYVESLKRLAKRVERLAIQQEILSGHYVIGFGSKFNDFRRARRLIEEKALEYIKKTKLRDEAPWSSIIQEREFQICHIKKTRAKGNKVLSGVSPGGKWTESPEFKEDVCNLLQDRITEKKRILETKEKTEGTVLPKILLLLDRNPYSEQSNYKECVKQLQSIDLFHSIFIVRNQDEGYFLRTQNEKWRNSFG